MRTGAIGLDLGTTSIKGLLLSPSGRVLDRAEAPAPLDEDPAAGRSEIPLEAYARAAERVLRKVLPRGRDVRLGIASQRSSFAVWDPRDGRLLAPGICWRDRRARLPWPVSEAEVIRRTGLRRSPHYSAGKLARLRPPAPFLAGPLPSWLAWRWSGGSVWAADPTLAARMLLWNLGTGRWDPALLRAFGIPEPALPRLLPTEARYGSVLGLELRAMIGDQQAAAHALGAGDGTAVLNLGTGAFLLVPTGRRIVRAPGLLTTVLRTGPGSARYALEGTVNAAGSLLRRGVRLPSPESAMRLPACLPAPAGAGAPRWNPRDRLRFLDDRRREARPDPAAALLGVACRIREIRDALPPDRRPLRLRVAGGLSRSAPLVQAVADLLGVPLEVSDLPDATALGAGLLALGLPPDPAAGRRVLPAADREAFYRRWRRLTLPRR